METADEDKTTKVFGHIFSLKMLKNDANLAHLNNLCCIKWICIILSIFAMNEKTEKLFVAKLKNFA